MAQGLLSVPVFMLVLIGVPPEDTIASLLVGYLDLFEEYSCALGFLVERQDVGQEFNAASIARGICAARWHKRARFRPRTPRSTFRRSTVASRLRLRN